MKKILSEIKYDASFIRGHTLQPGWYIITKVFLILGLLGAYGWFFGWANTLLFCGIFLGLSLAVHFLYRIKTDRYTRSWLDFQVREENGERTYLPIGNWYYMMVSMNLILAALLSQILL